MGKYNIPVTIHIGVGKVHRVWDEGSGAMVEWFHTSATSPFYKREIKCEFLDFRGKTLNSWHNSNRIKEVWSPAVDYGRPTYSFRCNVPGGEREGRD